MITPSVVGQWKKVALYFVPATENVTNLGGLSSASLSVCLLVLLLVVTPRSVGSRLDLSCPCLTGELLMVQRERRRGRQSATRTVTTDAPRSTRPPPPPTALSTPHLHRSPPQAPPFACITASHTYSRHHLLSTAFIYPPIRQLSIH